jgi:hypothetical protein
MTHTKSTPFIAFDDQGRGEPSLLCLLGLVCGQDLVSVFGRSVQPQSAQVGGSSFAAQRHWARRQTCGDGGEKRGSRSTPS